MKKRFVRLGWSAGLCVAVGVLVSAQGNSIQRKPPPPQVFQGRLEVRLIGMEKVAEWKMFPQNPLSPGIKAEPGHSIIVVKFEAKDTMTGVDTGEFLDNFELEDEKGNSYKSPLQSGNNRDINTNIRHVPVPVPDGVTLKMFRISGLAFDVLEFAQSLGKIGGEALANHALEPSRPLSVLPCRRGARLSANVRPQTQPTCDVATNGRQQRIGLALERSVA